MQSPIQPYSQSIGLYYICPASLYHVYNHACIQHTALWSFHPSCYIALLCLHSDCMMSIKWQQRAHTNSQKDWCWACQQFNTPYYAAWNNLCGTKLHSLSFLPFKKHTWHCVTSSLYTATIQCTENCLRRDVITLGNTISSLLLPISLLTQWLQLPNWQSSLSQMPDLVRSL